MLVDRDVVCTFNDANRAVRSYHTRILYRTTMSTHDQGYGGDDRVEDDEDAQDAVR